MPLQKIIVDNPFFLVRFTEAIVILPSLLISVYLTASVIFHKQLEISVIHLKQGRLAEQQFNSS